VAQNDLLRSLATVTPGTPPAGCGTRALELDGATSATSGAETCRRSRGLVLDGPADSAAPRGRDMEVRTDAGDDLIVKVFPFRHTARVPVQNDMVERADDEAGSAPPTGLPAEGDGGSHGRGTVGGPGGGKAPGVPVSRGIVMED
jgi:hypothetical protein